jgi:hypothetical protein
VLFLALHTWFLSYRHFVIVFSFFRASREASKLISCSAILPPKPTWILRTFHTLHGKDWVAGDSRFFTQKRAEVRKRWISRGSFTIPIIIEPMIYFSVPTVE